MQKTIRIPLIIDANGKWCAYGYSSATEADWSMMDEVADSDAPLVCPQQKWITVTVELPVIEELTGAVDAA